EHHTVVSKQVAKLTRDAEEIGKGSFDIESLRNEINEAESALKYLQGEKHSLEVEKDNNKRDSITLLQSAESTLNQASLFKTGGVYSLAGLLLGLVGVSYLEARGRRVHKPIEVHQELGIE